jgi:hypothetical protein
MVSILKVESKLTYLYKFKKILKYTDILADLLIFQVPWQGMSTNGKNDEG